MHIDSLLLPLGKRTVASTNFNFHNISNWYSELTVIFEPGSGRYTFISYILYIVICYIGCSLENYACYIIKQMLENGWPQQKRKSNSPKV